MKADQVVKFGPMTIGVQVSKPTLREIPAKKDKKDIKKK